MVFKRRKQLLDQIGHMDTATPSGTQGLLMEISKLLRHILRWTRIIVVAALVIVVVTMALQFQVSSRNDDIRSTKATSAEAKEAATEAKKAVEDAINQSREQNGNIDIGKLVAGLEAMGRVEQYICGGPCPNEGGK